MWLAKKTNFSFHCSNPLFPEPDYVIAVLSGIKNGMKSVDWAVKRKPNMEAQHEPA